MEDQEKEVIYDVEKLSGALHAVSIILIIASDSTTILDQKDTLSLGYLLAILSKQSSQIEKVLEKIVYK